MENRKTPKVKYATARANLLMVVLLTLANALLLAANSDYNFPFSAFIPQVLVVLGLNNTPDMQEFKLGFSILFVFLAFLILLFFFLAYLFSKKKPGLMVAALIVFGVDSLLLVIFTASTFETAYIIEYLFHAWVLYYLALGVKHGDAATRKPVDEEKSPTVTDPAPEALAENPNPENPGSKGPVFENPIPENPVPESPVSESPAPENPVPENLTPVSYIPDPETPEPEQENK